jgi:hypothetical protein
LATHIEEIKQSQVVREQTAEEDRATFGRGIRDWRRLHDEELHELKSSANIIRVII